MNPDLVSVIIPTYNRRNLVENAIRSVLAQTYPNIELIIIDDGSDDGTEFLLAKYSDRLKYVYQENRGESAARQLGVELSSGTYLAFLDSDDIWLPKKLERQISLFEQHPNLGFCYCWAHIVDGKGNRINHFPLGYGIDPRRMSLQKLVENNFIVSGSGIVIKRSIYDEIGGYNQEIQFAEDWDLSLRLAEKYPFACIPEPLFEYCLHQRGWLQKPDNLEQMLQDHLRIIEDFSKRREAWTNDWNFVTTTARANRYGRVAFEHYAYDHINQGCERLTQACNLAPEIWADCDIFTQKATEFAMLLVRDGDNQLSLRFIKSLSTKMPRQLIEVGVTQSLLQAKTYEALVHYYGALGNYPEALKKYILLIIKNDPTKLWNRGFLSTILRSNSYHLRLPSPVESASADALSDPWIADFSLISLSSDNERNRKEYEKS